MTTSYARIDYVRIDDGDPLEVRVRRLSGVVAQWMRCGKPFNAAFDKTNEGYQNRFGEDMRRMVARYLRSGTISGKSEGKQLSLPLTSHQGPA